MENLRLILLIIGCLIVLGIYLREVFQNHKSHKNNDMLEAVDELPDLPEIKEMFSNTKKQQEPLAAFAQDPEAIANLGNFLSRARNDSLEDEVLPDRICAHAAETDEVSNTVDSMNITAIQAAPSENDETREINEVDEAVDLSSVVAAESESDEETDIVSANAAQTPEILVLYIVSSGTDFLNGNSINIAAMEAGMHYGDMNIFHHFGTEFLQSKQPLLSMANMYEPGAFDLEKMADLQTKGLAIFMYAPPKAMLVESIFDLFLNTAKQVAALLDGTLQTTTHEPLNDAAINHLRDKAKSLASIS